jgi:hypothetical protein
MKKIISYVLILFTLSLLVDCGTGGAVSTTSYNFFSMTPDGNNVATVTTGCGYWNEPCVSVTVCTPGATTQCQTVNDILIDTGSSGLRLFSSAVNLSLPQVYAPDGGALAECTTYADGTAQFGPVVRAAIVVSGESALNVRMQIVNRDFPGYAACGSYSSLDTPNNAGYNGILGVGLKTADCGTYCETNAGMYLSCSGSTCNDITLVSADQVTNPVASFATDNQGEIFNMPSVNGSGQNGATGTVTFGIGTKANNTTMPVSSKIYAANSSGYFSVTYGGHVYAESFVDSGSNALYFVDNALTQCTGNLAGFYCPANQTAKSAILTAADNSTSPYNFNVLSASTLESNNNGYNNAFNDLGGALSSLGSSFDIGYPFFLGREVVIALDGYENGSYPYGFWQFTP